MIEAFVLVNVDESNKLNGVEKQLRNMDGVMEISPVAGGLNYIVKVSVSVYLELNRFLDLRDEGVSAKVFPILGEPWIKPIIQE